MPQPCRWRGRRPCALVIVDVQERYTTSADDRMRAGVASALSRARGLGIPIAHVLHDIAAEDLVKSNPALLMVARLHQQGYGKHHCVPLKCAWPGELERVFMKTTFDSFMGTGLDAWLKELAVTDILVCGLLTGMCVLSTSLSGFGLGYVVTLLSDATADGESRYDETVRDTYPQIARVRTVDEALPPGPAGQVVPLQNIDHHTPESPAEPAPPPKTPERVALVVINCSDLYLSPGQRADVAKLASDFAARGGRVYDVRTETAACPAAEAFHGLFGYDYALQPAEAEAPVGTLCVMAGSGILSDPDGLADRLEADGVQMIALVGALSIHVVRAVLDGFNRKFWMTLVKDALYDPDPVRQRVQPAAATYENQLCTAMTRAELMDLA